MSGLIYIGNGKALIGVPARDLSELEIDELAMHYSEADLIASGLYAYPLKINMTFEHDSIATAERRPYTEEDAKNDAHLFEQKPKRAKNKKEGE